MSNRYESDAANISEESKPRHGSGEINLTFIEEEEYEPIGSVDRIPQDNNNACPVSKQRFTVSPVPETGIASLGGRRRSSVEKTLRQATTRTFRRLSRAFTAVGLLPQLEIKLVGISEELEVDRKSDKSFQDLLTRLFEGFDYYRTGKLNQEKWIDLLKMRLNQFYTRFAYSSQFEERKTDFVEIVESVAYALAGNEDLDFDTFCSIFRSKNVLNKFYRLLDRDLDGIVSREQVMEFISQLSGARIGSRLTRDNIAYLERLFRQYVGTEREIKKSDFSKIIQTKNQFFTDRVFDIFDDDANGSISLQEFLDAMHKFTGENPEDKIRFLFKVYDVDGDGEIQEVELEQVMRACMEENGMKFSDEQIHELTRALFEDADTEGRGALTYESLKAQLGKHGGLLENLSLSIERWLVPVKPIEIHRQPSLMTKLRSYIPHQFSSKYLKNNYVFVLWLMGFFLVNFILFLSRAVLYSRDHPCANFWLILAKASGQALNFNCTYILVMMLKQSLTFLRARGASTYLPIDQHLYLHKLSGYFIVVLGLIHTISHLINIESGFVQNPFQLPDCSNQTEGRKWTYAEYLFSPEATKRFGGISGYAFNSGVVIYAILTVMFVCSLPFVRRGGYFQVFYWTHLLYVFFWAILLVHTANFWKWFLVPGIIFVIEQSVRIYRWRLGSGKTFISSGILLPSKVTHLIIRRPPHFHFQSGDYVFVRIPVIAEYEWHPFTISSSPEQDDAIWLHVRAVGEWTNRLYEYFEQEQTNLNPAIWDFRPKTDAFTKGVKYRKRESDRKYLENPLTSDPRSRPQLKSVADSLTSCTPPESIHSSSANVTPDNGTVTSSEDVLDTNDVFTKPKKLRLSKMNSMPNISEEKFKNIPQGYASKALKRSESVETENMPVNSMVSKTPRRSFDSINHSRRYLRYKPTIITFKSPLDEKENNLRESLIPISKKDAESLAEEGHVMAPDGGQGVLQASACYELGTTRISREQLPVGKALEIFIDGPLGAPSSHIFRAEHAVLIATGIGVTPFASILQSIMRRYWASRNICPNCNFTWCSELPESVLNLKKVDFFWINRDQRSFEWFVHLLSQLEIEQAELGGAMERFLDMHMFITSALQKTDMKAVGLQLALDLLHEKEKRDLITGLKTRTNAGRPNWSKVFKQLQDQRKGKITVFYCGPPALARAIKLKCDEYGFSFRKEVF